MKTKNKLLALLEIAIMLCSVFLVATLPAAAITNYESGITNYEETASGDDYVLGVYGNANEDDTIDMRDLTYVKLIFFGKKPETELADAKYDGKINPLDFIQIKLIIVGKENELTIVQYMGPAPPDITEEPVTVPLPMERIVVLSSYGGGATLCALGEQDKIVGITEYEKKKGELKTFLEDKPVVGTRPDWDIEKIMELKPDIVLAYAGRFYPDYEKPLNAVGIPVVHMDFYKLGKQFGETRNLGWMLGKQERAEELINFEQQHINLIKERVKDLKPEEKPRVYFESYGDYSSIGSGSSGHDDVIVCGGINIFADASVKWPKVDPEAVIVRNPQVIIKKIYEGIAPSGYDVTDTGPVEELKNKIMCRPGWDHIDAVKNGRVYIISNDAKSTHSSVWYSYMAKFFHPDKFQDVDPVDIHRDWFERFFGIEYKGVYAYPTYPVS